jgi:hypothetical protein
MSQELSYQVVDFEMDELLIPATPEVKQFLRKNRPYTVLQKAVAPKENHSS